MLMGYKKGKELENAGEPIKKYILTSIIIIILAMASMLFYQYSVGGIGKELPSIKCSNFCESQGYILSSMPPLMEPDGITYLCTCKNEIGGSAITIPLNEINS
jgi:hypothetical protein